MIEIKTFRAYSFHSKLIDGGFDYRKLFNKDKTKFVYFEVIGEIGDDDPSKLKIALYREDVIDKKSNYDLKSFYEVDVKESEFTEYIRFGDKNNAEFWDKGRYICVVYYENKPVANLRFYMEDKWDIDNPIFDIKDVKIYEGPKDGIDLNKRNYLNEASKTLTKYLITEITCESYSPYDFFCEFFFRIYDGNNNIKGEYTIFKFIEAYEDTFVLSNGWGNDNPGSWEPGNYRYEVFFLNEKILSFYFKVTNNENHGIGFIDYELLNSNIKNGINIRLVFDQIMRLSLVNYILLIEDYFRELISPQIHSYLIVDKNSLILKIYRESVIDQFEMIEVANKYFELLTTKVNVFSDFQVSHISKELKIKMYISIQDIYNELLRNEMFDEFNLNRIISNIKINAANNAPTPLS